MRGDRSISSTGPADILLRLCRLSIATRSAEGGVPSSPSSIAKGRHRSYGHFRSSKGSERSRVQGLFPEKNHARNWTACGEKHFGTSRSRRSGCPESSTSEPRAAWFHEALSVLQSARPVATLRD